MAAGELVNSATSEKLPEMDWGKNIAICELVAHDQSQSKQVIKAIKKRLGSKHANSQLYAVRLLEMLMNNIGDDIHKHVVDSGILPVLVKIVKKKSDLPVRERVFLLLDATQTSLGGATGKFPQYYAAYYDLVSCGVQYPQRAPPTLSSQPNNSNTQPPLSTQPQPQSQSQHQQQHQQQKPSPESCIIQKATNAYEVLKDVLDAIETQHSEGAKDEFTLDLVEQCSFQKQRVMHLVMASRDEKVVSRAIELNEKLQKVLARHNALLSARPTSTVNHEEVEEEEEAEQLFRRLRKGKACARSEDEEWSAERAKVGLLGQAIQGEMLNRPLIRPLSLEANGNPVAGGGGGGGGGGAGVIPPPPAKHVEWEIYFQENKADGLVGHVRGLSLHTRNASSSRSEGIDSG